MKVLLINGSPRGKRSNSLKLALSFIDGIKEKEENVLVDELDVSKMNINPCKGCFSCWKATPGVCHIKDDMPLVIEKEVEADIMVWSFPLYYFNVPGILKNLIDRQLPMYLPFMTENKTGVGSGAHDLRYDIKGRKHVIISTCGFYSAERNYDSVTGMFEHFLGKGNFEQIFCGQGELFNVKELSDRTDEYLGFVKKAGSEYALGGISEETMENLNTLLYPKDVFESMADASWGINKTTGEKEPEDLILTRQMAVLYNKDAYDGEDRVLEMNYTDTGNTYQILLGEDGSEVYTDGILTSTTRIDTPLEVWKRISRREISAAEALGNGMYTVSGDFSLMVNWNKFFGRGSAVEEKIVENSTELNNPNMKTMLIPWIVFWIAVSIDAKIGSLITLVLLAMMPLIMGKFRFIIWDKLTFVAVAILSVIAILTGNGNTPTTVGYFVFGMFWLISCFKEPLCAAYVKYDYGGEKALKNPLFMKPNLILAACWGILYVLISFWTVLLRDAGFGTTVIILNNIVPIFMGLFTVWFIKWYPAWKARGGSKA
jgi:multimeric flavodoxin WrbA